MTGNHHRNVTIVDACTHRGHGGSPTAVLIDDHTLGDDARRAVVRDVGTSHAAFVDTEADTVRFFTTHSELTNCGHGTIAAQAFLLHRRGTTKQQGRQRTGGRTFDTTAIQRDDGIEVWFDQGIIDLQNTVSEDLDKILSALGIEPAAIAADDGPSVASPGTPRLLVPVKTAPTLHSLRPDLPRLATECHRRGYLGCFVYTRSPVRDRAIARMFAPAIGVGEDVVNANSTGCLAAHLYATHARNSIEVEQGHAAGRPSLVRATTTATTYGISTRIGGTAIIRTGPAEPDTKKNAGRQ
ncbi:phenazine biosynthesis protein PhzF family [Micromonospora coriariae]|uniref:Phenazine biosynthesis protein PhzF family n=1 Tax=Micromonospora coriariae TaxID=285665 RepID=A0A1C4U5D1_9ACTN|nr:PhzF family phenazine biosynthesis protein [Micromonospora coriariae]SCE66871.1 phenazine biosynthesis protein PhzF family [Micromonospora coriariae]